MYLNLGNHKIGVKKPKKESRKDCESLKTTG